MISPESFASVCLIAILLISCLCRILWSKKKEIEEWRIWGEKVKKIDAELRQEIMELNIEREVEDELISEVCYAVNNYRKKVLDK